MRTSVTDLAVTDLAATVEASVVELNQRLDRPARAVTVRSGRGSAVTAVLRGRRRRMDVFIGRRGLASGEPETHWRLATAIAKLDRRPQFAAIGRTMRLAGMALLLLPIIEDGLSLLWPAAIPTRWIATVLYGFGSANRVALVGAACIVLGLAIARLGLWEHSRAAEQKAAEWGFQTPPRAVASSIAGTPLHPRPAGATALTALTIAAGVAGWTNADHLLTGLVRLYGVDGTGIYMLSSHATFQALVALFAAFLTEAVISLCWAAAVRLVRYIRQCATWRSRRV